MDFQNVSSGSADASTRGRERVFCHNCENEWFRDVAGLVCPRCDSDVTEIIDPENDPREFHDGRSLSSGDGMIPHLRRAADTDSDPEEADIEEHVHHGPPGFHVHRTTWNHDGRGGDTHGRTPGERNQPPDPSDTDQIMHRFFDMLNTFGAGLGPVPRPAQEDEPHSARRNFRMPGAAFGSPGGQVRTFTTRSGNGGFTSFTIATGPVHFGGAGRRGPGEAGNDDFQTVFGNILGGAGPPHPGGNNQTGPEQGAQQPQNPAENLAISLHQILNLLSPANARHGDAVYTQEALDRIISQMMEQNPQSNAAPPASEAAINKLERKKVDAALLGPEGKAECTICIDQLKIGEEVLFLPCKHWFHETCVVMWLKEHNTCPICRAPIEESNNNNNSDTNNNNNNNNNDTNNSGEGGPRPDNGPNNGPSDSGAGPSNSGAGPAPPGGGGGWNGMAWDFPAGGAGPSPQPSSRTQGPHIYRWSFQFPPRPTAGGPGANERSRNERHMSRDSDSRADTSRSRRNSMSPPYESPPVPVRQRSPTPSSRRRDEAQTTGHAQNQGQGQGPLSWIRNRFSRASGYGDGDAGEQR
ncbi:hypothetical protein ACRALDRAFT_1053905 [Sodiomyces alcalophilus JCM 7366]|uniref:uncharacterized protein n=1 Tax=Sodiomyces alcalophilus JCM 7366 TaxID=591952 RepID=UPI0039B687F4